MQVVDTTDVEAVEKNLCEGIAAVIELRIVSAKYFEGLAYVEVGPATAEGGVIGIGILFIGTGVVVHALGIGKARIDREVVRHVVLYIEDERVIVRLPGVPEVFNVRNGRVEGCAMVEAVQVCVLMVDEMPCGAALIECACDQLVAKITLNLE